MPCRRHIIEKALTGYYLVALSGAEQQDLGWQGLVVSNAEVREPRSGTFAIGRRDRRPNRDRIGRVLPAMARIGKAKAVTATARKIAVLFYNALRHGMDYFDPGASYYETRYRERVIGNLHRRAKAFGFILQQDTVASEVAFS